MRNFVGAVVLAGVLVSLSGCGDDGGETASRESASADGGASLGPDLAQKPEGWPEDISLPPQTQITASLVEEASEGRTRRTVNAKTLLSPEDAQAFYEDLLADWSASGGERGGVTTSGAWTLGDRSVSTTAADTGDATTLTVTVTEP
ncbi:MAG: hypothetical protein NTX33_05315 [Propionibacteriales bacterium]|nr:hypothetical protein [Propionibacteriales bacterium]